MAHDQLDPYRVLGVGRRASILEIARARRRMAKRYHPDVAEGAGDAGMRSVNEAWELLRDPARRLAWDSAHAEGGAMGAAWVAQPAGVAPRGPSTGERSSHAGWWALASFLVLMVALLAAGLVGSIGGPDEGIVDSPVLQDNLDRP